MRVHYANEKADAVFKTFLSLPPKAKPRLSPDGVREWTVLSGILVSRRREHAIQPEYECVALGTGIKCLPSSKLPAAKGLCLHDWHAEIVSIRAFNLYLLRQCESLVSDPSFSSGILRSRSPEELEPHSQQPFAIKDDVRIHMYCSEAPCGDASMELVMDAQEDATAWEPPVSDDNDRTMLDGRGYFSQLGVVRRKPSRGDAPLALSKSCSDKLAMKQCTSLLSSVTSILIHPGNAYLQDLTIPKSQYVESAAQRSFGAGGRMAGMNESCQRWKGGYSFRPFLVDATTEEFEWCRPRMPVPKKLTGSNVSVMWTPAKQEVLIGGTVQGHKQLSPRGASAISRSGLWRAAWAVASSLAIPVLTGALRLDRPYNHIKSDPLLEARGSVKRDARALALRNWQTNDGDDDFTLE